jgi:hypothetical protein
MARNMYRGQGRPRGPRMNMSSTGQGTTPRTSSVLSMPTPISAGPTPLRFPLQRMTTTNQPRPLFVQVAELREEIEQLNRMRRELTPSPPDTPIPGPSRQPEVTYRNVAMMQTGGHRPRPGPTTTTTTSPQRTPSSWSTSMTPRSHSQSLSDTRLDLSMSPPTVALTSPQSTTQQQQQQQPPTSPNLPSPITTLSPVITLSITMMSALTLPPSLLMVVTLINNQGRVMTMGMCYVPSTAHLQLSSEGVVHATW